MSNQTGPGTVNEMDRATIYLPRSTMGIVGMGGIGCEIARRALAFGMEVHAVDRFPERVTPPEGVQSVSGIDGLADLLRFSDFAVIAAPHTPETAGWFNAKVLSYLRPSSYLINIGAGRSWCWMTCVAALPAGTWRAALEFTRSSRCRKITPLLDFPNVILTPHTAGYSTVIAGRHLAALVENVGRLLRGEPLLNVVDKALWF